MLRKSNAGRALCARPGSSFNSPGGVTKMPDIPLTFACTLYDRTVPLCVGDVRPAGIDLQYIHNVDTRSIFDRMVRDLEFDAAEMSITEYAVRLAQDRNAFVAIPAFPSRMFRHGFICVNKRAGIESPKDLEGKRIGVPLYTMTAAVFIRGLLMNEYGVDLSDVQWIEGAVNDTGSHGNPDVLPLNRPAQRAPNTTGQSLDTLLESGQLDAILGAVLPRSLGRGSVQRLFPDFRELEKAYFRRTGVFPVMHVIVIRKDVYQAHPFVAASLYRALCDAKEIALARMRESRTLAYMLPWMRIDVEELDELFPHGDPWPYGVEANLPTLEAFAAYLFQQGMVDRHLSPHELFVPV